MRSPSAFDASGHAAHTPPSGVHGSEPHAAENGGRRQERVGLRRIRPVIHLVQRTCSPLVLPDAGIVDHALVLVLRGKGEIVTESTRQAFEAGRLLLIPPYVRHRFVARAEDFECIAVHFDLTSDFMASGRHADREPYEVVFDEGLTWDTSISLGATDSRRARLERLVRLWGQGTPLSMLRAEALLMDVIASLLRTPEVETARAVSADPRIERALAQIERRIAESISVAELARSSGLGVSQFSRLFSVNLGERPASYIRRRRLELARRLLDDTDTPINAIAAACGFRSAAHFSRTFFAAYGAWPSQHRQSDPERRVATRK